MMWRFSVAEKLNVYSVLNVAVNKGAVCRQWLQNDFHTLEISTRNLSPQPEPVPLAKRFRIILLPPSFPFICQN